MFSKASNPLKFLARRKWLMATKSKTFDCVEMKRQAQEKILAEWKSRKHEFSSYGAFLEATIRDSEWTRKTWERAQRQKAPTSA